MMSIGGNVSTTAVLIRVVPARSPRNRRGRLTRGVNVWQLSVVSNALCYETEGSEGGGQKRHFVFLDDYKLGVVVGDKINRRLVARCQRHQGGGPQDVIGTGCIEKMSAYK